MRRLASNTLMVPRLLPKFMELLRISKLDSGFWWAGYLTVGLTVGSGENILPGKIPRKGDENSHE